MILLAYIINSLASTFILKRATTARDRYTLRKAVSILVTVLAFASFFAIWIERTSTLIIAYGILSAGIAIALQDLLRSIAGGILIITSNPFKAGDRIQVVDNIGDVLDIGNFSTKLMEIRMWGNSDQKRSSCVWEKNIFVATFDVQTSICTSIGDFFISFCFVLLFGQGRQTGWRGCLYFACELKSGLRG